MVDSVCSLQLRFADARSSGWCELPRDSVASGGPRCADVGGRDWWSTSRCKQQCSTERINGTTHAHTLTHTHTHARTSCSRVTTERIERDLGCSSHTQSHGSAASWPSSGARERVKPRRHDPLFFCISTRPAPFLHALVTFSNPPPPPLCTVSVSHSARSSVRLFASHPMLPFFDCFRLRWIPHSTPRYHSAFHPGATSSNVAMWIRRRLGLRSSCSRMDDRLI